MALGLEQQIASYVATQLGLGLYSDPTESQQNVHIYQEPPATRAAVEAPVPTAAWEAGLPDLIVTVYPDVGGEGELEFLERHGITIQVRHPQAEVGHSTARDIFELLHENGGVGVSANAQGDFGGILIARITADFPPFPLGRDTQEQDGLYRWSTSYSVVTKRFAFS